MAIDLFIVHDPNPYCSTVPGYKAFSVSERACGAASYQFISESEFSAVANSSSVAKYSTGLTCYVRTCVRTIVLERSPDCRPSSAD